MDGGRKPMEQGPWTPDPANYAYTAELSPFGWAWEFLRRNPLYRAAALTARASPDKALIHLRRPDGGLWAVERRPDPEAWRWGLEHFVAPDRDGVRAAVFWTEAALGGDLETFFRVDGDRTSDALRLADIPGRKAALIRPGRRVRLLVEAPGYAEMLGAAASLEPPPDDAPIALGFGAWSALDAHLVRIEAFAAFCRRGSVHAHGRRAARRLADVLVALDGWLDGRAYREIAHAFHDADAIETDWRGPGALKLRMRRRVAAGLSLMRGGYGRFLKAVARHPAPRHFS